jgi:hypothetical protein
MAEKMLANEMWRIVAGEAEKKKKKKKRDGPAC